jgi:hypothetical protein
MSAPDNKRTFKVTLDTKEVELAVLRPTIKQKQEGQKVYNKAFRDAVESGGILRAKVENVMREQKLWDDTKQKQLRELQEKIAESERRIKSGGIKLSEAREIALQMRKYRAELRTLNSDRIGLDNNTAEGQADNAQFNFFVSACTVFNDTGKQYFKSYEDFLSKEVDPAIGPAASNLAMMLYGIDPDYEKRLPENEFLKKYKFVDNELNFIDKQGRRVDSEGRLVNEDGRYINEEGKLVDVDGNLVDEDGNYIVDFTPFLDESGKPIKEEEE